jgi:hypothetical protein
LALQGISTAKIRAMGREIRGCLEEAIRSAIEEGIGEEGA